jgi:hypothetical protein
LGHPAAPRSDFTLARGLRAVLDDAGFTARSFTEVVGDEDLADAEARAGTRPQPLSTMLRLFAIGRGVPLDEAKTAFGALGIDGAVRLGVVAVHEAVLHPSVRIVPHDILLLASDLPSPEPPADHVAAAHAPSRTLARLTVRRPVDRALDIGTGNGIQALLLAAHARSVVATDVSERALRFTELNAALNGLTNVETRLGSFLEPVAGERFDAVVCNPPYVISPESRRLDRDARLRGDVLSEQLVREVPALLNPGAFATVLVSWVPRGDDPEPLGWLPADCGALVLRLNEEPARTAAEYWHTDRPPAERGAGVERWLDYYRRESIESIAYGAVVLQGRAAHPWREWLDVRGGPPGPAGAQLERIFAAQGASPPARYAWAPGVRTVASGELVTVSLHPGLGLSVDLPAATVAAIESGHGADANVTRDLWALGLLVPRP